MDTTTGEAAFPDLESPTGTIVAHGRNMMNKPKAGHLLSVLSMMLNNLKREVTCSSADIFYRFKAIFFCRDKSNSWTKERVRSIICDAEDLIGVPRVLLGVVSDTSTKVYAENVQISQGPQESRRFAGGGFVATELGIEWTLKHFVHRYPFLNNSFLGAPQASIETEVEWSEALGPGEIRAILLVETLGTYKRLVAARFGETKFPCAIVLTNGVPDCVLRSFLPELRAAIGPDKPTFMLGDANIECFTMVETIRGNASRSLVDGERVFPENPCRWIGLFREHVLEFQEDAEPIDVTEQEETMMQNYLESPDIPNEDKAHIRDMLESGAKYETEPTAFGLGFFDWLSDYLDSLMSVGSADDGEGSSND